MSDFNTHESINNEENVLPQSEKKNKILKELLDYAEIFVVAICLVIIIFSFFFRVCKVSGASMEDTLHESETLIITDVLYTPQRGDIIVFHDPDISDSLTEDGPLVKRVIATGGEKVKIEYTGDGMRVTITDKNGKQSFEKYDGYTIKTPEEGQYWEQRGYYDDEWIVPEGSIFVMGDNRFNSTDSRRFDCVDERTVLGKVIFRVTPLSKIGMVK